MVCVESNFILELAFLRDEHEACTQLLVLAETHALRLAVPAFSVGETYEALVRRAKQRSDLHNRLRTELGELSRSQPYQHSSTQFEEVTGVLIRSSEDEKRRLDEGLDRILNAADIIPIELRTIRAAIAYQQRRALSPQDSIVYASIVQHLAQSPREAACFVTKNSKDFNNPDIENELQLHNCRLLTRFRDTLGYVQSQATEPNRPDAN